MRQDYPRFRKLKAEIVAVGTEKSDDFRNFWTGNNIPYIGISDPKQQILKRYGQEVNVLKLGRMPAQFVIDEEGIIRHVHYGQSMSDIPTTDVVLAVLESLTT